MDLTIEKKKELETEVHAQLKASIETKEALLQGDYAQQLISMAERIAQSLKQGGKLMLCGNGGSAADAQHLAAELLVRLRSDFNRKSIPAISLALDTSTITACANDYGYEHLYERMVEGLGKPEDVLLGITTSGRSPNILLALEAARKQNIATMGFLGGSGGPALDLCEMAFVVPSDQTNRIQEAHITAGHILMDLIEQLVLGSPS